MTAKQSVLSKALKLPEKDRLELAEALYESLDGSPDADVEEAWAKEIERRVKEIDSGRAKMIPWSVALKRLKGTHKRERRAS